MLDDLDEENPHLKDLKILKAKMTVEIEARLDKRSRVTSEKCRLSMIPIHLIEYELKNSSTKNPVSKQRCSGKVLIAGSPPKIRFILRSEEVKPIEDFARRKECFNKIHLL